MKTFTCPARYLPSIRAAISLAMADAGRDVKRRERGDSRTMRPELLDESLEGMCVVQIGIADPIAQEADANWPAESVA